MHYHEDLFPAAFFGILHEAGHGIYEQRLPVEHWALPLSDTSLHQVDQQLALV